MRLLDEHTVIAIHRRQIAEHGGPDGIRDIGLLESALARPRNKAAYASSPDIAEIAAAYGFGIAKGHPFVDGNKRVALVAMRTFLVLNRFDIRASQEDKYLAMLQLAEGSLSEARLADWVRDNLVELSDE